MARTLKGTRARGLPPKLLLSRKQDATGSFPTVWRTASDNRTGKYPVFFNDNKVVLFNQPVTTSIGLSVSTYPQYEEQIVTVGSPGNPVNSAAVSYSYPFTGVPMVVLTEITPNAGTPTVNAFLIGSTVNGIIIGFSAPFEGTIVYRAVFLSSPGQPVNVVRSPRFTNQYSLVVNQGAVLTAENNTFLMFSDFGSAPPENYVTFFDFYANNQADISSSVTYITNTSVQVTASATATNVLYYMGVGQSTASIDVTGIVYPLVMTPEAINAGLSQQDKTDLYKQPYFSGSMIVNQPIVTSGSMVKGVSDLFVTFTPGQDIEPFIDYENPEVDAKLTNNSFFATGSAVTTTGLGFQQPLWSKNKLEIDLDVSTPVTFGQSTYDNQDKLMAYYDFSQKTYVPIGDPRANNSSTNQLITTSVGGVSEYFSSKSIGFSQSVRGVYNNFFEVLMGKTFAAPINSFGFPYDHKRYGVGNNGVTNNTNMLLPLNDLISEPFLLEKIVLEFTGAMSSSGTDDSGISAISTFFILNQSATNFFQTSSTNQYLTSYFDYSATPPHKGAIFFGLTSPTLYVTQSNYNIDLVTYAQISALSSSIKGSEFLKSLYERDLNIYQEAITPVQNSYGLNPDFGYSGSFVLSASVRNSLNFEGTALFKNYARVPPAFDFTGYTLLANKGGRKNLTQPCGRNWKTLVPANAPPTVISIPPPPAARQFTFIYYEQTEQTNPYILLPTDKLIIGWQAPFGNISGSIAGNCGDISQMHFPAGKGRLILYGSTLRLNPETNQLEEHHDTLNQLLSSNSIHEVIGE